MVVKLLIKLGVFLTFNKRRHAGMGLKESDLPVLFSVKIKNTALIIYKMAVRQDNMQVQPPDF
ncbi:hypothetical protein EGK65_04600 [Citrobacter farmeri]|nr:hypothetical protein EGK65_04600 [Citrobacter farmeri]